MEYLTAHYDKFILPQKPQVVTDQELSLIQSYVEPGSKILDVGCGTGRHLIPLAKLGYEVVGVERNSAMIEQLKNNFPETKLFEGDILEENFARKIISVHQNYFDLIILMWNSVCEMAYTQEELTKLVGNLDKLLSKNGRILVQVDQTVRLNPLSLNFITTHTEKDGTRYTYKSTILKWDEENTTSTCNEALSVEDGDDIETFVGEVRQRWWSKEELEEVSPKIVVM